MADADKRRRALAMIDPSRQVGLEIGPLDKPIVTKDMGSIVYVDHELTPVLREKYANDPAVDIDSLVDVDFGLGDGSLVDAVGSHAQFDYVVASHVIEHVPNAVGWLQDVADVLRPGGTLSLVIPDKRYTFDYLRWPSRVSELIEAHLQGLKRPSFRQVFDSLALAVNVDLVEVWEGRLDPDQIQLKYTEEFACENAYKAREEYVDSHCWVFTPASFFAAVRTLIRQDLFDYKIVGYTPTRQYDLQFFVSLEKIDPGLERASKISIQEESMPIGAAEQNPLALHDSSQGGPERVELLRARLTELGEENDSLRQQIEALLASRSWRITGPLRWLSSRFEPVRRRIPRIK